MNRKETLPAVIPQFSLRDQKVWVLLALIVLTLYALGTMWSGSSAPAVSKPRPQTIPLSDLEGKPKTISKQRVSDKVDPLQSADPSLMPQLEVDPKEFRPGKTELVCLFYTTAAATAACAGTRLWRWNVQRPGKFSILPRRLSSTAAAACLWR